MNYFKEGDIIHTSYSVGESRSEHLVLVRRWEGEEAYLYYHCGIRLESGESVLQSKGFLKIPGFVGNFFPRIDRKATVEEKQFFLENLKKYNPSFLSYYFSLLLPSVLS